jgi:glycosyltransferase involved in cell wall biosynthesis
VPIDGPTGRRVALIGPAHPYKGGGARHTTELAHRLAAAGHNVLIESWRAQYPARLYPGQQTVDEPEGRPYPRTHRRLAWYSPASWFAAGRRLRSADLVVFALITPIQVPAYLAILAGLGRRQGTVVICHNVLPHERRPADVVLTRALLRHVGGVLVHSPDQAAHARELTPGTPVAIASLPPHWPDAERETAAPPPHDGIRLLFFGIVRPYKGLDVLLRALSRAPAGLTLTVAGEFWGGPAGTEKLIADLGIGDRVTLRPGYVPASEVPALFVAADALVLPYRAATASQNAQLAFAHGVPVITTTAGSLAEHVTDGVNGLTVAPGEIDDLLGALRLISEPGTLPRLRAAVRPPDPEPAWAQYLLELFFSSEQELAGAARSACEAPRVRRPR